VFGNSEERVKDRGKLNGIVHPAVRFYMLRSVLWYYIQGYWAVVLDIPLLFESGLDVFVSTVVVVAVSEPSIQMERLRSRDPHLSEEDARNRVASQTDVREKAKRAEDRNGHGNGRGFVVYNDKDKEDLRVQVDEVVRQIREDSPRWWSLALLVCPPLMVAVSSLEVYRGWMIKKAQESSRGKELPKPKL